MIDLLSTDRRAQHAPLPQRTTRQQGGGPCKDYDADCDDMTMAQITACHANPGDDDDHCGYCVMKHRCN